MSKDKSTEWANLCRITGVQSLPYQTTKYMELLAGYDYRPWVLPPVAHQVTKLINDFAMYPSAMKLRWGELFDVAWKRKLSSQQLERLIKLFPALIGKSRITRPKIQAAISELAPEMEQFLNDIAKIGENIGETTEDGKATEG